MAEFYYSSTSRDDGEFDSLSQTEPLWIGGTKQDKHHENSKSQ